MTTEQNNYIRYLYNSYLGREPATDEYTLWINKYSTGLNNSQILDLFKQSDTYLTDLINTAFKTYYARTPTTDELTSYLAKLKSGDLTSEKLMTLLADSNEAIVVRVYKQYLNRMPDDSGRKSWLTALNAGTTEQKLIKSIKASEEYKNKFITQLYSKYLLRTPSDEELTNWKTKLTNGFTEYQLINAIKTSDEYKTKHKTDSLFTLSKSSATPYNLYSELIDVSNNKITDYSQEMKRQSDALVGFKTHQEAVLNANSGSEVKEISNPSQYTTTDKTIGYLDLIPQTCPTGYALQNITWYNEGGKVYSKPTCKKINPSLSGIEGFSGSESKSNHQKLISNIKDKLSEFSNLAKSKSKTYNLINEAYTNSTTSDGTTNLNTLIDKLNNSTAKLKNTISTSQINDMNRFINNLKSKTHPLNEIKYLYLFELKSGDGNVSSSPNEMIAQLKQFSGYKPFRIATSEDLKQAKEKGLKTEKSGYVLNSEFKISDINGTINGIDLDKQHKNRIWIIADEKLSVGENIDTVIKFNIGDTNIHKELKKVHKNVVNTIKDYSKINDSFEKLKTKIEKNEGVEGFSTKYENIKTLLINLFNYIDSLILENDDIIADISVKEKDLYNQPSDSDCYTAKTSNTDKVSIDKELIFIDHLGVSCKDGYALTDYDITNNGDNTFDVSYKCCRI